MVKISQGDIFGRIGTGLGQGLSEQIPKEIERGRLVGGLTQLANTPNLTPLQGLAGLVGAGAYNYPQLMQTSGDLLRQNAYLNALQNQFKGQEGPQAKEKYYRPNPEDINKPLEGEISTLANPQSTAESYKNYIPPSETTERQEAYQNFQANPARYDYDFDKALAERKQITKRNQEIQKAHQEEEKTAIGKEEIVKNALDNETKRLGLNHIPPKAYQKFEEKVINAILSKKEGGEGLTQENAIKKYSKEADQANRNYLDLESLSAWSPLDFNRRLNSLQKDFASRDERQPLMDKLISEYQLSPLYSAHRAYPIEKGEVPTLNKLGVKVGSSGDFGISLAKVNDATYEKLKKEMGNTHSPLSIAYELERKGHNPRGFLDYLSRNRDKLEVWQADQLNKNINVLDLKDIWLRNWE